MISEVLLEFKVLSLISYCNSKLRFWIFTRIQIRSFIFRFLFKFAFEVLFPTYYSNSNWRFVFESLFKFEAPSPNYYSNSNLKLCFMILIGILMQSLVSNLFAYSNSNSKLGFCIPVQIRIWIPIQIRIWIQVLISKFEAWSLHPYLH